MKKNNAIEFLKDYYSEDIIAQACAYCDEFEWDRRIEHWDEGKGVDGTTDKISQFHNIDEKIQARLSFDNK